MKKIILLTTCAIILAGCKNDDAPDYTDVKNIIIDGKHYTAAAYSHEFCQKADSPNSKNCVAVWNEAKSRSLAPVVFSRTHSKI